MTRLPSAGASSTVQHPEWIRSASLYQINTRQFTADGTFAAAEKHLPRLRDLGVDVLWLMPIHEIGRERRKGSLGSPYAVRDHLSVSEELGGRTQFDRFLQSAHDLGFRVILDWVANHTAWDHAAVAEHPDWFRRDDEGRLRSPVWCDWEDVVELDFSRAGVREYMADAMCSWVETGVDGFRCDVAGFVPLDFWEQLRPRLASIRPVFLLAEWESRDLHAHAFDATYAWSWYDATRAVARGERGLEALASYYAASRHAYPPDALRMTFVSNHDKNSWEGTQFEEFGDGLPAAIALSILGEGIPLIYCGQEAGNARRLSFFERDPIEWREHPIGDLVRRLLALKRRNTALWNGSAGGVMEPQEVDGPDRTLVFVRRSLRDLALVCINFSGHEARLRIPVREVPGGWVDAFDGSRYLTRPLDLPVAPWGFRALEAGRDSRPGS